MESKKDPSSVPEGPENLSSTLLKVGSILRKAREGKHLSIEEVAESLHIGPEQLIALEKGNEELLPERVFIKAMIRRVAERLQVDANHLIN